MKHKRVFLLAITLAVAFGFLLYHLANIQLFATKQYGPDKVNLLKNSVEQRTQELTIKDGRGSFLDRNHQILTQQNVYDVVFFPFLKSMEAPVAQVASITNIAQSQIKDWLTQASKPFYLSEKTTQPITKSIYEKIKNLDYPGILAVVKTPAQDPSIAEHFLGLVRDNDKEYFKRYPNEQNSQPIGISGLEESFDPFLVSNGSEKLLYHVDAKGNPLFGLNFNYQGNYDMFYPVKIKTTIDRNLQKKAEEIIDQYGLEKGGLVLLDIKSRDVLAMVSRPKINYDEPYQNDAIKNQMLTAHFPGSVFKTVIAAAALEHPTLNIHQLYDCNQNVYGDGPAERQLGNLTFDQSFALSCNHTFASLAQKMVVEDPDVIETYAQKLGLLGPAGWQGQVFHFNDFKQFPNEELGTIWGQSYDKKVPRAVAQTGIGQKEVKVTPLAMANMMATIANNGIKEEVRGVQRILYQNGATMVAFDKHEELSNDRISPYTAMRLKELLREVVTEGTGHSLQGLQVAGKSGTAQTGKPGYYNHWFAGYFPSDHPQYAMVVVDLKQTYQKYVTYPVYKDMVKAIYEYEKASN